MTKNTEYGNATVIDFGLPERLDGAKMQFYVSVKVPGEQYSRPVAYVGTAEDAIAIARLFGGETGRKAPNSGAIHDQTQPTTPDNDHDKA